MQARVTNVIVVEDKGERYYFSLEGLPINQKEIIKTETTKGGVIKPPSPAELQHQQDKEKEKELTLEERLRYEQSKAT